MSIYNELNECFKKECLDEIRESKKKNPYLVKPTKKPRKGKYGWFQVFPDPEKGIEMFNHMMGVAHSTEAVPTGEGAPVTAGDGGGMGESLEEVSIYNLEDLSEKELLKVIKEAQQRLEDCVEDEDYKYVETIIDEVEKELEKRKYSFDTELTEAESFKKKFFYQGPIYSFGEKVVDFIELETHAKSLKQAINNIKYQAADAIDLDRRYGANVDIKEERVQEVKNYREYETCPECGRLLAANGNCPVCDDGEEDYE